MITWHGKQRLLVLVTGIAALAVLAGLYTAGSPAEARLRRLDARRVADLRHARQSVDYFWTQHGLLPPALDSLFQTPSAWFRFRDPATAQPYSYRRTSDTTYDLCADFARPSSAEMYGGPDEMWDHTAGPRCFHLVAPRATR